MKLGQQKTELIFELLQQEDLQIALMNDSDGKGKIELSVENFTLSLYRAKNKNKEEEVQLRVSLKRKMNEKHVTVVGGMTVKKKTIRIKIDGETEETKSFEKEKKLKKVLEKIITLWGYIEENEWKYTENKSEGKEVDNKQKEKEIISTAFIGMLLECIEKNKEMKEHYRKAYFKYGSMKRPYKTIERAILLEEREAFTAEMSELIDWGTTTRIDIEKREGREKRRKIALNKKREELNGKIRMTKFGIIEESNMLWKYRTRISKKLYDENSIVKSGYFLENLLSEIEDEKEIMSDQEKFATLLRFMLVSEELKMNRVTETYSLTNIKQKIIEKFHLKESREIVSKIIEEGKIKDCMKTMEKKTEDLEEDYYEARCSGRKKLFL